MRSKGPALTSHARSSGDHLTYTSSSGAYHDLRDDEIYFRSSFLTSGSPIALKYELRKPKP